MPFTRLVYISTFIQRPVTTKHVTCCVHSLRQYFFDPSAFIRINRTDDLSRYQCFSFDCHPPKGFHDQAAAEPPSGVVGSLQLDGVQADDEALEIFRACLEEVLKVKTLRNMRA